MSNPWLNVPLDDYEGHMSLPAVGQSQMIAEQLDRALERWAPTNIAVIGCAGGNGLETIEGKAIERIVAVDVNPYYIERVRTRYAQRLRGLALVCADVQSELLTYGPVDFTYAALLFEYVGVLSTLRTLKRNSRPNAVLTAVLQLPHTYKSQGRLASAMTLVAPETLRHAAADVGFVAAGKRPFIACGRLGAQNLSHV